MKSNLLLLDSFKDAESLIGYAFSFSNRTNRQLKIVYIYDYEWMQKLFSTGKVIEDNPLFINAQTSARKEYENAEIKLRYIMDDYLKRHSVDVPMEIILSNNNRVDLIQNEIEKNPDTILLMSNHQSYYEASGGAIGYPNLIMHLTCPVLVVPGKSKYAVLEHVLYATDFHPEDISSLKHLSDLLNSSNFKVAALHNQKDPDYDLNLRWKGFLELVKEQTGLQTLIPVLKKEKNILKAIESYISESNPDFIVVLKEKKGFMKELFSKSNTEEILKNFNKPVLVYHEA